MSAMRAQLQAAAAADAPNMPTEAYEKVASAAAAAKPASREGRVHVGAWLPKAYARHILLVRAKTGLPVKSIFASALNDVFRAHGVPVIDDE